MMTPLFPEHLVETGVVPYQEIMDGWNAMAERAGLAKIRYMHSKRKAKLRTRWREGVFTLSWPVLMETIPKIPFLVGKNPRGWRVTFDFVIRSDETYLNILEGKYGEPVDVAPAVTPEDEARQADAEAVFGDDEKNKGGRE